MQYIVHTMLYIYLPILGPATDQTDRNPRATFATEMDIAVKSASPAEINYPGWATPYYPPITASLLQSQLFDTR
jgi:hypothetical protein